MLRTSDADSPASSPISYLWHQSTIQAPARDYQNPNWQSRSTHNNPNEIGLDVSDQLNTFVNDEDVAGGNSRKTISPIQRPSSPSSTSNKMNREISDLSSVKSYGTHSVASTHSLYVFIIQFSI